MGLRKKAIELVGSKLGSRLDADNNDIDNVRYLKREFAVDAGFYPTIQDALDEANKQDIGVIYIPPGTYDEFNIDVYGGQTVIGAGRGSTIVEPTSSFNGANGIRISGSTVSDVTVRDMTVKGSQNSAADFSDGILIDGGADMVTVDNVRVVEGTNGGGGILVRDATNLTLTNIYSLSGEGGISSSSSTDGLSLSNSVLDSVPNSGTNLAVDSDSIVTR